MLSLHFLIFVTNCTTTHKKKGINHLFMHITLIRIIYIQAIPISDKIHHLNHHQILIGDKI